jgi:DNA-directed RNA polymerase II subunit RPB1
MSRENKGTIPKDNVSRIIGIQFSLLSPEEIRKGSVAEITSRDTYIGNKPVIGGLFDPRMGVQEPGFVCPTDGLNYIQTPGYFGHMELARPVFYIQYLTTVIKILRCVCIKCSKLLISKETHKHALSMSSEHRWQYVFQHASKVKRCGDECEDGCGCRQANKIKKEGLATLFAEWDNIDGIESDDGTTAAKLNMKLTPDAVLKIFRRISDEDVNFMGFSPIWSRPDWMICQVLAVPPPAVRPSVKHDSQQRSEDDISHIIVNMFKANKTLQTKIEQNAPANVIDDWATVLQYYVATQIDNKIPGVASVAQRSGRPLKSIKERLNGKGGRVRGNLMGKRVDYSARSVITPDPNLSIRELGVPLKIAKNITRPVQVTEQNRNYLLGLVHNGPDVYPGAKILERANGDNISLRYVDRLSVNLQPGDIVHRHMLDGDGVLFNRQPTLHRMSMMCHIARIMMKGDTFRMNVGDTKPYNADFDGDEMNLHMPQDDESEAELKQLAAVPYQIISPANNQSIVGIFQDSLLGAFRLTRPNIEFSRQHAMTLLMHQPTVDLSIFKNKTVSNFDLLSQILPPLTLSYKTKLFSEDEDKGTSNNVLEIRNGEYVRGQMEKGVLGTGSKGLIHRICNDFGNMAAARFIDDLQNIVTEYMKSSAYSVGISDLIANQETKAAIVDVITTKKQQVANLIDQTQIGIFENNTGRSNKEEFETQVNSILNQATSTAGKIGRKSLDSNNRFVIMVEAGSKGSDLNISQMISCLGQQNVDGKRIPYGFENRTLPHYTQYDDSPGARGFVENSFISGLTPQELFFHAMGGRVGLIDTAVKTSQTGYIQRRLIKGMEDLVVAYDMTVRNNKGKIIQYSYGDDGVDPVKVENQFLPVVSMSVEDIFNHFSILEEAKKGGASPFMPAAITRMRQQSAECNERLKARISEMIDIRHSVIDNVFKGESGTKVHIPVNFAYLIDNAQGQQQIGPSSLVDITPLEALVMIDNAYTELADLTYAPPTHLFRIMFYYYLSPNQLLTIKRFNRKALVLLLETVKLKYKQAIVAPGEMVGMIAAQSIGEPTTQMTLNTFHFAGVASKSNVTRGVPRIEEILALSENPKNPSLTVYLKHEDAHDQSRAQAVMHMLEHTKLGDLVSEAEIYFDPLVGTSSIEEDRAMTEQYSAFENLLDECNGTDAQNQGESKWMMRLEMNKESMLSKNITMDDIHFAVKNSYGDEVSCVYSDYNSDKLIFRIRIENALSKKKVKSQTLDQSDEIYMLKGFQDQILNNVVIRGVKRISKVIMRKLQNVMAPSGGNFKTEDRWVLDTVGTNLIDALALDYIDSKKTTSNNISEVYRVLGIEAARQAIYDEIADVIEFDGTYVNFHHMSLLCDRMTCSYKMISIFRHGINNDNIGPIAKASFEETPEMFLKAARHGELDNLRGISSNVMCGQEGYFGTNSFQTLLDMQEMNKIQDMEFKSSNALEQQIASAFGKMENPDDPCGKTKIQLNNNIASLKPQQTGDVATTYDPGF